MQSSKTHVVIVGGGASGTLLARHLLDQADNDARVTVIEKRTRVGKGFAYDTRNAKHVVNVRASNMSAFPDDPGHFLRWLSSSGLAEQLPCADQFSFVPRSVYGHYLESLIDPFVANRGDEEELRIINGECVSIERDRKLTTILDDGAKIESDVVVLATGNEFFSSMNANKSASVSDRRMSASADDTVLLLGTGLTMIDHVLSLVHEGHTGRIVAISRRGLLPQSHQPTVPVSIDRAEIPFGKSVSEIALWLRAQIEGGADWRATVDALRPYTQELWQKWSPAERGRFLRHARPWWDVHRHRMAPEVESQIKGLIAEGRLTIIAGKISGLEDHGTSKKIRFRRRNGERQETLRVQKIVECRGIDNRIVTSGNAVLRNLAERGMATADDLDIGIKVTSDCALVSRSGTVSDDLFAVGPLTRGEFWEVVAVPDIRVQCQKLARHIARRSKTPLAAHSVG